MGMTQGSLMLPQNLLINKINKIKKQLPLNKCDYKVQSWRPRDVGDGRGSGSESANLSERESAQQSPRSSSQLTVGTGGRKEVPGKDKWVDIFSYKKCISTQIYTAICIHSSG